MMNPNLSVVPPGRMIRKRDPLARVPGPRGLVGGVSAPRVQGAALRHTPIGFGPGKARLQ